MIKVNIPRISFGIYIPCLEMTEHHNNIPTKCNISVLTDFCCQLQQNDDFILDQHSQVAKMKN